MKDLIDLQHCHATQTALHGVKTPWQVLKNNTEEKLWEFPATFSESQVFAALDFAKHYELIALNAGIDFQKDKQNSLLVAQIDQLRATVKELQRHNESLAETLDRLTAKGV